MVIKTDLCNYTEYKIYPGRGQKYVGKDAKVHFFLTAKADSLFHQKIKAVKLTWSQAWRRMNKKGKIETNARRNKKKTTKFQKAIVGMSLEDMKRKRAQRGELRQQADEAAKVAAAKEAKARAQKKLNKPAAATSVGKKAAPQKAAPKQGGGKKDFKGRK